MRITQRSIAIFLSITLWGLSIASSAVLADDGGPAFSPALKDSAMILAELRSRSRQREKIPEPSAELPETELIEQPSETVAPQLAPQLTPQLRKRSQARPAGKGKPSKRYASKPPTSKKNKLHSNRVDPVSSDVHGKKQTVADRWRIVEAVGVTESKLDPYNRNPLKADRPIFHDDWFFNLNLISDTLIEQRKIPTPVGAQSGGAGGRIDVLGDFDQTVYNQNIVVGAVLYQGNTVFRPPDYEFRFTGIANANRVESEEVRFLHIDPADGDDRDDQHFAVQELLVDKHLRNVSDRYDFDSIRVGIQPFNADFRGFLFRDDAFGVRLFGNRDNNRWQYNLAWFRRLEKDTNSGLNDLGQSLRDDDVFVFNLYRQDLLSLGFISQFSILHNRNNENDGNYFDENGFLVRPASLGLELPRDYQVTYLGYSGDGHLGRINLSTSSYVALGDESVTAFSEQESYIEAYFFAAEVSVDFSWWRTRLSFLYGSGDGDPFDDKSEGFDSVFESPTFAGNDASYWFRQPIPLIGGGGVAISGRNGLLNSMRSSKDQGQSNFVNPGLVLVGVGSDIDLLPELRWSIDINYLSFDTVEVLQVARNQGEIDDAIGLDVSTGMFYRPKFSQNMIVRGAVGMLLPGQGYKDLFGDEKPISALLNLILAY